MIEDQIKDLQEEVFRLRKAVELLTDGLANCDTRYEHYRNVLAPAVKQMLDPNEPMPDCEKAIG